MAKETPQKRLQTLKAKLTDEEMEALRAAHAPVSSVEALTLIIEWFVRQGDVVRKEVLGLLPAELRVDVGRLMLERMASADPGNEGETSAGSAGRTGQLRFAAKSHERAGKDAK